MDFTCGHDTDSSGHQRDPWHRSAPHTLAIMTASATAYHVVVAPPCRGVVLAREGAKVAAGCPCHAMMPHDAGTRAACLLWCYSAGVRHWQPLSDAML